LRPLCSLSDWTDVRGACSSGVVSCWTLEFYTAMQTKVTFANPWTCGSWGAPPLGHLADVCRILKFFRVHIGHATIPPFDNYNWQDYPAIF